MIDFDALKQKHSLMTLEDALVACFGSIESGNGETEGYTVSCCGEIRYGSGIMGSDIAECQACGRKIINVLSPHVSPLLIDHERNTTAAPSEEVLGALRETPWMVVIPDGA